MKKDSQELRTKIEEHRQAISKLYEEIYNIELKDVEEEFLFKYIHFKHTGEKEIYMWINHISTNNGYNYKFSGYKFIAENSDRIIYFSFTENDEICFDSIALSEWQNQFEIITEETFWVKYDELSYQISNSARKQTQGIINGHKFQNL